MAKLYGQSSTTSPAHSMLHAAGVTPEPLATMLLRPRTSGVMATFKLGAQCWLYCDWAG